MKSYTSTDTSAPVPTLDRTIDLLAAALIRCEDSGTPEQCTARLDVLLRYRQDREERARRALMSTPMP